MAKIVLNDGYGYRTGRVYITPDRAIALWFAVMRWAGEGQVYEVEPFGVAERDPDWLAGSGIGETKQCERARVIEACKIPREIYRMLHQEIVLFRMQHALQNMTRPQHEVALFRMLQAVSQLTRA